MSHLDELDEYEAELELQLRKEYSAVFGLFRYCVLTQDATYLCNKLDLQYVPQPAYPFFQLKMEDVWVWDKNRPTRIIPRAEVFTSSDVTIEELRGEGDEPKLTAETLAERIGESLLVGRRHLACARAAQTAHEAFARGVVAREAALRRAEPVARTAARTPRSAAAAAASGTRRSAGARTRGRSLRPTGRARRSRARRCTGIVGTRRARQF